jgi:tetratricopeptide (TPR) repeat protein
VSAGAIAVATSIMPTLSRRNAGCVLDGGYQKLCIRSWLDCGFRVISVNHADEIPELAIAYPEVTFVTTKSTSGNAGRRLPYISDLLRALLDAPEPVVGIVNSDIVFEPSTSWQTWLPATVGDGLVTGQRHDATSLLHGTFRKYYWGFDFFFFDIKAACDLLETASYFAMGLPWWDYWLPAALSLKGREILTLERPAVIHLIHKEPSLDDGWRQLAMRFATFIVQEATKCRGALPPGVNAILPICRSLVHIPELRWRNRGADAEIGQIAVQFIPAITRKVVNPIADNIMEATASMDEMIPAHVFHGFAERLSAGEALERAKQMERQGDLAGARSNFGFALERTPRDFDLLCAYGEFSLRQGNCADAVRLLRRAIENDQDNRTPYVSLAVALYQSDSRLEAIKVLENTIAKWPDFEAARELMSKIRYVSQQP